MMLIMYESKASRFLQIWDIEALNKDATEYHKNWDRERVGNNNLEDLIELSKQSKNQKDPAAHRIEIFDKLWKQKFDGIISKQGMYI